MKKRLLIIHLSDLHISNEDTLSSSKQKKIIDALGEYSDIAKVVLLISGDLANDGAKDKYDIFRRQLNSIRERIKIKLCLEEDVNCMFVPGNHDINFNNKKMTRSKVFPSLSSFEKRKLLYDDYLGKMSDFFSFAKKYSCFIEDKILCKKSIIFNDYNIEINLINTAICSLYYKNDKPDNDKGLHFIEDEEIARLKKGNSKIVITVMHHSPDWFDEECKHKLEKSINENSNFLLYGHEHIESELDQEKEHKNIMKICGGKLSPNDNSIFTTICFDEKLEKYDLKKFVWDDDSENYISDDSDEKKIIAENYILKNDFFTSFIKDSILINVKDFRDFFVFPDLIDVNNELIKEFGKFIKQVHDSNICIIEGDSLSGKTTLGKYIYLHYIGEGNKPIFLDVKETNEKTIKDAIHYSIFSQYDKKKYNNSLFEQDEKKNRIIIIDNADNITNKEFNTHIEYLKQKFGKIIILTSENKNYDILEETKKYLNEGEKTLKFKISSFYREKRKLLTKKVISAIKNGITDAELNINENKINTMIENQINIVSLNPSFLVMFINTYMINGIDSAQNNIFNNVFVTNIVSRLNTIKVIDVETSILLLQRIALSIHKEKEYPYSVKKIIDIINNYNEEAKRYRKQVNPLDFIENMRKCKIFESIIDNSSICFTNNNYLSYFIAKEIIKKRDFNSLNTTINEICFGINGDIMLFVSFLDESNQMNIIETMIEKATEFFNDIEELSFDSSNISYILNERKQLLLSMPSSEEKKRAESNLERQEKRINANHKIKYKEIYDYDVKSISTLSMVFLKSLRFIEIIAKILPDFIQILTDDQIYTILKMLYSLPNKAAYKVFKPLDDCFKSPDFKKEFNDENEAEMIKIISIIQRFSSTLLLNIYDNTARFATNNKTIQALTIFETDNNLNYKIQKAIFYDNYGDTEKMGTILYDIYKNTKNNAIKNITSRIFQKHLTFNGININSIQQRYLDTFYPDFSKPRSYNDNKKKQLAMIRGKNKL